MTKDKYQDLILCAISSVVPAQPGLFEMMLQPNGVNRLRVPSIVKVDRIVTLKKEDVITTLGKITDAETKLFKELYRKLVD